MNAEYTISSLIRQNLYRWREGCWIGFWV